MDSAMASCAAPESAWAAVPAWRLYLDVDGVLQPDGQGRLRTAVMRQTMGHLLAVVAASPRPVELCWSTSWRMVCSPAELCQAAGIPSSVAPTCMPCYPDLSEEARGAAVARHAAAHPVAAWIALDDHPERFLPGQAVVATPSATGLDPVGLGRLAQALQTGALGRLQRRSLAIVA